MAGGVQVSGEEGVGAEVQYGAAPLEQAGSPGNGVSPMGPPSERSDGRAQRDGEHRQGQEDGGHESRQAPKGEGLLPRTRQRHDEGQGQRGGQRFAYDNAVAVDPGGKANPRGEPRSA